MKHLPSFTLSIAACALVASTLLAATPANQTPAPPPASDKPAPAEDPGASLFTQMCSDCHDAARIVGQRRTKAEWQDVLTTMIDKGAIGSEKDFEAVFGYLVRTYGKVFINSAGSDEIAAVLDLPKKDADAIVAYRKEKGSFPDLAALKKVPDVELKKLDEHKDAIAF
jgi:cytochrome c5